MNSFLSKHNSDGPAGKVKKLFDDILIFRIQYTLVFFIDL